jgi:Holliday junction resolvase-like predicted endonuclease
LLNPVKPPQLSYWLREVKTANAEIDYVTSSGNLMVPIEVKAGKSGTLKSLHQFVVRKKSLLCVHFDLNPPEIRPITHSVRMDANIVQASFNLLSLPLYMVEALPRILVEFRSSS